MIKKAIGVLSVVLVLFAGQSVIVEGAYAAIPVSVGTSGRIIPLAGDGITIAAYMKIKMGMTLSEVEAIIGIKGKEWSSAGSSSGYGWSKEDGRYILCLFSDGRLNNKSHSLAE